MVQGVASSIERGARMPPPDAGQPVPRQGSALLGRRRPQMERPGWRSAMLCVGIMFLTVLAVGFMFVVTAYMVSVVRGHLPSGKERAGSAGKKAAARAQQGGIWSSVEASLAPKDSDDANRRLLR